MCRSRKIHLRGLEDTHRLAINVFFQFFQYRIPHHQVNRYAVQQFTQALLDTDKMKVSVQCSVKEVQVIEPAMVETSPTGQPYRLRPGNSGDDVLAVDS